METLNKTKIIYLRLSPKDKRLLDKLTKAVDLKQPEVLRLAIRDSAEKRGVKP
jgi:hypothetical protein